MIVPNPRPWRTTTARWRVKACRHFAAYGERCLRRSYDRLVAIEAEVLTFPPVPAAVTETGEAA